VIAWAAVKQGVAAVAIIGAILYYVRWMNRWFEQHAAAEFWLKQFQLDIDRASWVVETALEWRKEQKTEISSPFAQRNNKKLILRARECSWEANGRR